MTGNLLRTGNEAVVIYKALTETRKTLTTLTQDK